MSERIVIIGTYPLQPAMHGGQKRTEAIIKRYKELGHEVRYISISTPNNYTHYAKFDFRVPEEMMELLRDIPSNTFTEAILCQNVALYPDYQQKIVDAVRSFNPTMIEYEQAYAYLAIGDKFSVPVIFSSHNVEWLMKQDIAISQGCSSSQIEGLVDSIRTLERTLVKKSKYILCVSESDADQYRSWSPRANIIIAPNGIDLFKKHTGDTSYWKRLQSRLKFSKTIAFVASAHPPNLNGFRKLIDGVGFLPIDTRIIVAGGLGDMIKDTIKNTNDIQESIIKNRTILAGRISQDRLVGLLNSCDMIILPIVDGGGSNLKTAEAIIADKRIVATRHAFRGYEDYIGSLPNLYIADTPEEFQEAILVGLSSPKQARTSLQQAAAEGVLWSNTLVGLGDIRSGYER